MPSNFYEVNGLVDPIVFNAFKKGGKIQKAQPGTKVQIPEFVETVEEPIYEPYLDDEIRNHFTGEAQTKALADLNNAVYDAAAASAETIDAASITADATKKPATTTSAIGNPFGKTRKPGSFGSMVSALGGVASNYALATRANRQQLDLAKDTYNSTLRNLETNTPEFYNRYQDAGVGNGYEKAAASVMSNANKAMYSDPTLNEAVRMNAAEQAAGYLTTGEQAKSQAYQN